MVTTMEMISGMEDLKMDFSSTHEMEERMEDISSLVHGYFPKIDIKVRFIKTRNRYEGLLWGVGEGPEIGAYESSEESLQKVIESLHRDIEKECKRAKRFKKEEMKSRKKNWNNNMADHKVAS